MPTRVLITGAFGQLGAAVVGVLASKVDLLATGRSVPESNPYPCTLRKMDVSSRDQVRTIVKEFHPDVVINLAALTDVDGCETDPALARRINVEGIENLVQTFNGHLVQISTDYVFNGKNGPYAEEDPVDPINEYGRSKLEAERRLEPIIDRTLILRTNVVFDYTSRTQASFVKWVVDSLKLGTAIKIVQDQWNNPTWTTILAEVIELGVERKATGLFHYGGKDWITRYQFALSIADIFHLDPALISPITTAELNQPAPRPLKGGLKTGKIERALGVQCVSINHSLLEIRKKMERSL